MNLSVMVSEFAEAVAAMLELAGVVIIAMMAVAASLNAARRAFRKDDWHEIFKSHRLDLNRGILLGLDFLVGADIVHTVAVNLTYASIGALGLVVLIRAFIIFSLEVEITGNLPWRQPPESSKDVRPG